MNHEYSVLGGVNRARIGQVLALISAGVASTVVAVLLSAFSVAKALGLSDLVPSLVLPPVSAGLVFTILYWVFDRHAWKIAWVSQALGVPNLAGVWRCQGQTINPDKTHGFAWTGEVLIVQSWDRIRLRLKTDQSTSNSVTAALLRDEADGYRLFYSYRNEPRVDQPELNGHRGYAEMVFRPDLRTAEGEYFNGLGRFTFGLMTLTKEL